MTDAVIEDIYRLHPYEWEYVVNPGDHIYAYLHGELFGDILLIRTEKLRLRIRELIIMKQYIGIRSFILIDPHLPR
jgi:hypothetical protein